MQPCSPQNSLKKATLLLLIGFWRRVKKSCIDWWLFVQTLKLKTPYQLRQIEPDVKEKNTTIFTKLLKGNNLYFHFENFIIIDIKSDKCSMKSKTLYLAIFHFKILRCPNIPYNFSHLSNDHTKKVTIKVIVLYWI